MSRAFPTVAAIVAAAIAVAAASTLQAQLAPAKVSRFGLAASVDAGVNPTSRLHAVVGPTIHATYGGWGALALGYKGTGAKYTSTLLGGALSRRVLQLNALSGTMFVGYGTYSETGWSGIERSSPGWIAGGMGALDFGRLSLRVSYSDFRGRYDGKDVVAPFSYNAPRVTIGLAIHAIR